MERVSIATPEYIESGHYYEDARDWYNTRYILPINERTQYIIFSAISLFLLAVMLFNITLLFPTETKVPFFSKVDNFAKQYSVITPLGDPGLTVNQSIAKYLISRYIKAREEYYPSNADIEKKFYFVHQNSSAPLFKVYQEHMSTSDPDSPLLKYQLTSTRTIEILNIIFDENPQHPETMVVTFRATVNTNQVKETTNWQATLSFNLSDPVVSLYNNVPFEFTVTNYEVQKI
ncbi:MAG: hypothetical protein IPP74_06425 [Alphaproteobacteria bacterium]|nr:hypothetical protein [Alphaproteobacteria bacterium]